MIRDMTEIMMRIGEVTNTKPSERYTHTIIQGISPRFGRCFAINGSATKTIPVMIKRIPSSVNGVRLSILFSFNSGNLEPN